MPKRIAVEYGQYKDGYGFGQITRAHNNRNFHLVDLNRMSNEAVCGRGTWGSREYVSGFICPDCAEAVGLTSADEWEVDQEQYDWMKAQHE
jgi:hypothetical protein